MNKLETVAEVDVDHNVARAIEKVDSMVDNVQLFGDKTLKQGKNITQNMTRSLGLDTKSTNTKNSRIRRATKRVTK